MCVIWSGNGHFLMKSMFWSVIFGFGVGKKFWNGSEIIDRNSTSIYFMATHMQRHHGRDPSQLYYNLLTKKQVLPIVFSITLVVTLLHLLLLNYIVQALSLRGNNNPCVDMHIYVCSECGQIYIYVITYWVINKMCINVMWDFKYSYSVCYI